MNFENRSTLKLWTRVWCLVFFNHRRYRNKFQSPASMYVFMCHAYALRCVRSHSRSVWYLANL